MSRTAILNKSTFKANKGVAQVVKGLNAEVKNGLAQQKKKNAKFAISFQGEQVSLNGTIFWRPALVSYGTIVAAVTSEGKPCAILLHPSNQSDRHTAGCEKDAQESLSDETNEKRCVTVMLNDLKTRLPVNTCFVRADEIVGEHTPAIEMLRRLIHFVQTQSTTSESEAIGFKEEAKSLQSKSVLYGTAFQHSVWRSMAEIPIGDSYTYTQLTQKAGQKSTSVRAVAQACGTNPLTFLLPCHRVVAQGGALGGYHWGTSTKQAILKDEKAMVAVIEKDNVNRKFKGRTLKLIRT